MRIVALRPRAVADVEDIWAYTVQTWSEAQAITYLTGLNGALALLAEFPEMARLREEFDPPMRLHPYRAHLIVYSYDAAQLDVVRILHHQANWAAALAE